MLWRQGYFSSTAMTAFAYTGDTEQTETTGEAAAGETQPVIPEQTESGEETEAAAQDGAAEGAETPFSIPGNGEVLDDKAEDGTKEFLTIQTKNGNTFFLVLDRSSNTENVYMLSMIDENDLAEFMDETQTEETPQVVIPETEPTVAPEEAETEAVQPEEGGMNMGAILAIGILAAGAIGVGYYFKVVSKRKRKPRRMERTWSSMTADLTSTKIRQRTKSLQIKRTRKNRRSEKKTERKDSRETGCFFCGAERSIGCI